MKVLHVDGGGGGVDPILGAADQLPNMDVHAVRLAADVAATLGRDRPDVVAIAAPDIRALRRWTDGTRGAGIATIVWGGLEGARAADAAGFADALQRCLYVAATPYEAHVVGSRGVAAERVFVIGPAVNAPLEPPAIDREPPAVLVAGDCEAPLLASACDRVWRRQSDVRIIVRADTRRALLALVPAERHSQILEAAGAVREAAALASVVVWLHDGDAAPVEAIEGWAAGRPIVGWRRGALPSLVDEGLDGVLVEHGQPGALAVAIVELTGNIPRAREMGSAGHSRTLVRHAPARVAEQLGQVFVVAKLMSKPP